MNKNCYILWILLVYFGYAPLFAQNSKEVTAKMILGNPKYQGIDTSFLVATLTAAIQELKAELDATKAEVQALKGVA